MPTRNSTAARSTVRRTYLSAVAAADSPALKYASACAFRTRACLSWGMRYWGMYDGSGGAFGFFKGWVAIHASKAGRSPARRRLTATRNTAAFLDVYAVSAALNDTESSVRIWVA